MSSLATIVAALEDCLPAPIIPDVLGYIIKRQADQPEFVEKAQAHDNGATQKRPGRPSGTSRAALAILSVLETNPGATVPTIARMVPDLDRYRIARALAGMAKTKPPLAHSKGPKWYSAAAGEAVKGSKAAPSQAKSSTNGSGPALSDLTLEAVKTMRNGGTSAAVIAHLRSAGVDVRPNLIGLALSRHAKGGRLTVEGKPPSAIYYAIETQAAGNE